MLNKANLNQAVPFTAGPTADDLRRTFETAVAQIQHKPLKASQTPIVVRRRATPLTEPALEKQALTNAARALAQLWNISPSLVR